MPKAEPEGCLTVILEFFGLSPGEGRAKSYAPLPYEKKQYLLTRAERSFYEVLRQAVGEEYLIFTQIRLADLIYVRKGTKQRQSFQNKINAKHVDFLLCDPKSLQPMLAIELDDASHQRADRQKNDRVKEDALTAAGLPLLRVRAKRSYDLRDLQREIAGKLEVND